MLICKAEKQKKRRQHGQRRDGSEKSEQVSIYGYLRVFGLAFLRYYFALV